MAHFDFSVERVYVVQQVSVREYMLTAASFHTLLDTFFKL